MKIAMAQIAAVTGDLDGNAQKVVQAIQQARQRGCDLVVTPEAAITGYLSCDLLEVDAYVRANKALLTQRIAPEVRDLAAVVGFVDYEEGPDGAIRQRYNSAALIENGQVTNIAHKQHLCRFRFYDETRYFAPGLRTNVANVSLAGRQLRVAFLICEDLWEDRGYTNSPYREACEAGADLIVAINASPFETGKWQQRLRVIEQHLAYKQVPLVYVNTVSIGDNLKDIILFDGRSMAFDGGAAMCGCGPLFAEDLVIVELDEQMRSTRTICPAWSQEEELFAALTFGFREYCRQTGFSRAVLGVSGGIDSALCAALAAEALGRENVLGVNLPSRYNSPETRSDAAVVCGNLGIDYAVIAIEDLFHQVVSTFGQWKRPEKGVTIENFQARLRGILLMGIANDTGRLVIATGNKSELGLGYCTLYGDMVGGLLLIGDLNKSDVYRLSAYINQRAGRDIIPESVIRRVPSAELRDKQVDPFDYPVVAPIVDDLIARVDSETIMKRFLDRELDERYPSDLYDRYDEQSFRAVLTDTHRRYHNSAFKRSQASPIVIVSKRALGFDLRETIINWWCKNDTQPPS